MINEKNFDSSHDYILLLLVFLNILNLICIILKLNSLRLLFCILTLIIVVFSDTSKTLQILMFVHPNSGLYDSIGFKYLFNFAVIISAIKLIIKNKGNFPKNNIFAFLLIFALELFLELTSYHFDTKFLSMGSWFCSYLILILESSMGDNISFEKVYKYFFFGFTMAFICGIATPVARWGLNIPTAYRFVGLLRDPNYYCVDALLLIFGASTYSKLKGKNKFIYIFPCIIMGICSVSKMFILLLIMGLFLSFIVNFKKINIKKILPVVIVLLIGIFILYKNGLIDMMINKYLYRTETTSALTGRDYLWGFYFNSIFASNKNFLIGNSLNYYSTILNPGVNNLFFTNMVAHNTYLDIVLSWGAIGMFAYIFFIFGCFIAAKKNHTKYKFKKNSDFNVSCIVFLCALFVLSYLSADAFAILITYLIVLKYGLCIRKEDENG